MCVTMRTPHAPPRLLQSQPDPRAREGPRVPARGTAFSAVAQERVCWRLGFVQTVLVIAALASAIKGTALSAACSQA
jgi:hypothetical protein